MKIFFLVTKSEIGGAQVYIYQLAKYFIGQENKLALMAYPNGWLEKKAKELEIKFYSNHFLSNNLNPLLGLKTMKEIKKAVFDFQPDLISCYSTAAGFWGRLAIKNKIPTIFTVHGWGFAEGTPFWRKLVIFAEKIAAKFCSKIICVCQSDKNLALKYRIASSEKIIVIHNGVEINNKFSIFNHNPFINGLGPALSKKGGGFQFLNKKIKIVFVGRLNEPKDPLLLLKAFNELKKELKDKAEISIIGEGKKRKKIEEFIKNNHLENNVKLLGELPREKVFEILSQGNIFVLISNYEGFPLTILEAMSFGLAIVASNVGGVKEVIDDSCGILVEKGDKEGLKTALEKLLKNPEFISNLGKNAQNRVKEKFSLEKMLKETEKIYFEILS